MEIEAVSAQGGVVRLGANTEQARELAVAKRTAELHDRGMHVQAAASPNVTTSVTFSPSVYAQAAQYQLYTQSGTLASMLAQSSTNAPEKPLHDKPDDIHEVDGVAGSSVDAMA